MCGTTLNGILSRVAPLTFPRRRGKVADRPDGGKAPQHTIHKHFHENTLMTTKPTALTWLWLSATVLALDQLSKWWAVQVLQPMGVPHEVIPGFLNWTLMFNVGAAFSFLSDGTGWQRWFFVVLAVAISTVLVVWLARTPRRDWRTAMPLALIIGGAIGNLIDRLHVGQVTDFIQVYFRQWSYPVFNVADCGITVGAVMLVVFGLFAGKSGDGVR